MTRILPARSVKKRRPSGAKARAQGVSKPVATTLTTGSAGLMSLPAGVAWDAGTCGVGVLAVGAAGVASTGNVVCPAATAPGAAGGGVDGLSDCPRLVHEATARTMPVTQATSHKFGDRIFSTASFLIPNRSRASRSTHSCGSSRGRLADRLAAAAPIRSAQGSKRRSEGPSGITTRQPSDGRSLMRSIRRAKVRFPAPTGEDNHRLSRRRTLREVSRERSCQEIVVLFLAGRPGDRQGGCYGQPPHLTLL